MECAYAPYNWTQNDDANGAVEIRGSSDYAYGYDVMMAKKIGEALGQKVQIVKLDWDSLIPAVMSGDVDCVIAGQSITAERAAQVREAVLLQHCGTVCEKVLHEILLYDSSASPTPRPLPHKTAGAGGQNYSLRGCTLMASSIMVL